MSDPDPRDPGLDSAYRDTPRDEPPSALDDRIRAAARRAVGASPRSLEAEAQAQRRRSFLARWRTPVSIAATVVLAVTLTLMILEEEQRPRYDGPASTLSQEPAPEAPTSESGRVGAMQDARPGEDQKAMKQKGATSPSPQAQQPARPSSPPQAREERFTAAPQTPQAEPAPVPRETLERRRSAPPVPGASTDSAAAAAPPVLERDSTRGSAPAPDVSEPLRRDRALERPARAHREAASTNAPPRSPDEWIEAIRRLKTQGLDAEATAEIAEFRRRYPDYTLPPDLVR
jgi:resuscitation-promoting factor RpfA